MLVDLRERAFASTFCRFGRHSRRKHWIFKFNGGNGAWLCRNCRLIIKRGYTRQ